MRFDAARSPPATTRASCATRRAGIGCCAAWTRAKDQSYFLFSLTQEQLARALFPSAISTRRRSRACAAVGLRVADKPDSQEICFVPDGDYAGFVEREAPDAAAPRRDRRRDGRVLGTHDGIHASPSASARAWAVGRRAALRAGDRRRDAQHVVVGPREALGAHDAVGVAA